MNNIEAYESAFKSALTSYKKSSADVDGGLSSPPKISEEKKQQMKRMLEIREGRVEAPRRERAPEDPVSGSEDTQDNKSLEVLKESYSGSTEDMQVSKLRYRRTKSSRDILEGAIEEIVYGGADAESIAEGLLGGRRRFRRKR